MERKKVQVPVRLAPELLVRIRRILYWRPLGRSLQSIAEKAILEAVQKIEKEEGPFKPTPDE